MLDMDSLNEAVKLPNAHVGGGSRLRSMGNRGWRSFQWV
jgi:hypothetical protein